MRKKAIYLLVGGIFLFLFNTNTSAQVFKVQLKGTDQTPIFLAGHEGDTDWITGVNYDMDIFWFDSQTKIGTLSGTMKFRDPPLSLESLYASATLEATYTIDGYGTFTLMGEGYAINTTESLNTGTFFVCSNAKILNGTSYYQDWFGAAVSWGTGNLFMPASSTVFTEIWYLQYGSP